MIPVVMVVFWVYALLFESVTFQLTWLALMPVFVLDQVVSAWKAGVRGRLVRRGAAPAVGLRHGAALGLTWRALLWHLRSTETIWIT